MLFKKTQSHSGFTLIETLVGTAVFLIISVAVYQAFASLFILISDNQYKIIALNLANEQFEIVRNLSYSDVGEVSGIPNGKVPHSQVITRSGIPFTVITTIRNVDLPYDGTIDGTPDDLSPADNKLIEVEVDCSTCKGYVPVDLTTTVAPKNLETASTNGALFVKVFDANGKPVVGANVHIVNSKATSTITIDDVTDDNGMLQVVDAPPGVNAYAITVSKTGYSTARTYPPGGGGNPSPTQPDATVIIQQVTQVSLSIDKLSTLTLSSITPLCVVVPAMDFNMTGSKNIGTGVPKFSQNLITNGSGTYTNNAMEWDSYSISGIDSAFDIVGINPLNPFAINPNSTQHVDLIVYPKNPRTLLVTVKDAGTGLPVTGATVDLKDSDDHTTTQVTDRGSINQSDWSSGSGQVDYTDVKKYLADDGNIDTGSPAGEIKLKSLFGSYAPSGTLESSTIDTGTASNFSNLVWSPTDQPVGAGPNSVRFQLATNYAITATTTWTYLGPDSTASTYYTFANTTINPINNGNRYLRYKLFLSTIAGTSTPNIGDIGFSYTSSCTPPGQVAFSGLSAGSYTVTVSKSGYTTSSNSVSVSSGWQENIVNLSH